MGVDTVTSNLTPVIFLFFDFFWFFFCFFSLFFSFLRCLGDEKIHEATGIQATSNAVGFEREQSNGEHFYHDDVEHDEKDGRFPVVL